MVRLRPLAGGYATVLSQRLGQEIGPVILHPAWTGLTLTKSILQQLSRLSRILFRSSRQIVELVPQAVKAGRRPSIGPIKANQPETRKHLPIGVAVEFRVDQYIAFRRMNAPDVAGLHKISCYNNASIRVHVTMAWQAEAGLDGLNSRSDAPKEIGGCRRGHARL
jgi:hypothetical protein